MAVIHLVRHGQASFGKDDYDQLSDLGRTQAVLLGEWLRKIKRQPTHIVTGSLRRHKQTRDALLDGFQAKSIEQSCDDGFNEIDHIGIINAHRPELADPQVMRNWLEDHKEPIPAYFELFTEAMKRWIVRGENRDEYQESWTDFKHRTLRALNRLANEMKPGDETVVVTSGGPIAMIALQLMNMQDHDFALLNRQVINTSVTSVIRRNDQNAIHRFNNYSHLEVVTDPGVITAI
ncbi:histidine phosphatase family protein [Endozoicomonadaceae bacterium StTr2]